MVKEQGLVKEKVRDFFKERFSGETCQWVKLDNAEFNRITNEDNALLVGRITEEEAKSLVWSCDSDKSSSPNDF